MKTHSRTPLSRRPERSGRTAGRQDGSQLVEFALALPILLLLVVGIWDFGSAYVMKDKLTNAAREGARITVSNSLADPLGANCGAPCSIVAAATAVAAYMTNASLDASCIHPAAPTGNTGKDWVWSCANGTRLEIDKGFTGLVLNGVTLPATRVSLTYRVVWKLAGFLPGADFPTTVTTVVTMQNLVE
ncbi:MAG TPA: TadE family protein [Candidatus Acidoferrales bacterium]|nr:TadE family protein [Candidatus Acidoferrales bacterium]